MQASLLRKLDAKERKELGNDLEGDSGSSLISVELGEREGLKMLEK